MASSYLPMNMFQTPSYYDYVDLGVPNLEEQIQSLRDKCENIETYIKHEKKINVKTQVKVNRNTYDIENLKNNTFKQKRFNKFTIIILASFCVIILILIILIMLNIIVW